MARYERREFRLGDYWLSQRTGSPAWHKTWYDETSKQTKRSTLGTDDFDTAKRKLEDWYMAERMRLAQNLSANEVTLKEVFRDYLDKHAVKLRSYASVKIILRYWTEFYGDEATVETVRDARRQEEFREYLAAKKLRPNSINRVLEAGRSAINRAYKRNVITSKPYVELLPYERDNDNRRALTVDEMRKLYGECADHMRLFMILMLGTGARNEAICHLEWPQMDFEEGLIYLNPVGRKQTSKRRPTVRMVPFIREVFEPLKQAEGRVLTFRGKSFNTAYQGIGKAVGRAKLPAEITPYYFRHTVARWLRREGVSPWETAMQLGHKVVGFSMTERYAAWSPDYLENASKALDKLLRAAIPLDAPLIPSGR